jgi:alginate O-acetyltransferase complex protein AlgI
MLFETPRFALFALAVLIAFHAAPPRARRPLLLMASLAFAATFSWWGAVLLVVEGLVAWFFATRVRAHEDDASRLRNVAVALVVLLGCLAAFKYVSAGASTLGLSALSLVAPVGISYYTFKLVGFVLDTHWDKVKASPGPIDVLCYAAFFPQLLTGPIQRPQEFFAQTEPPSGSEMSAGLRLILFGLVKKLVIADRAGIWVDQVYAHPDAHAAATITVACYLYALQLYADFSGYTDIALGLGRLFGIKGPPNFALPWFAPTVQEFWRRWHMSLSSWLTDYLFTPLRMALRTWGTAGLVVSLSATMIAIGVWHGPRWTYVTFGALNAAYLVGSALTLKWRDAKLGKRSRARRILQPLIVAHLMILAFIVFRADTLSAAAHIAGRFGRGLAELPAALASRTVSSTIEGWSIAHTAIVVGGAVLMEVTHWLQLTGRLDPMLERRPRALRWGLYYTASVVILLFGVQGAQGNIYFKF